MKISAHKFGGASVSDAQAIQRVGQLLSDQIEAGERAVVVVSAMGKTTNTLEAVWSASAEAERRDFWATCVENHMAVAEALGLSSSLMETLRGRMESCWQASEQVRPQSMDAAYDAMVAAGELASTTLVAAWLAKAGMSAAWWDVRDTLHTSGPHRFARVDESMLGEAGTSLRACMAEAHVVVTQGFIGRHADGSTSTLGREGSDYSAALLAVAVGAEGVTIWKDVPGMMNADPKRHPEAVTVPKVDHAEALELSYYGASVIHPRTVKPLQLAGLPLWVKSFVAPEGPSTRIDAFPGLIPEVPMFIWRDQQTWMEIYTADGSFLVEDHLTEVFGALGESGIHVRLMQQSATHFGVLADRSDPQMARLEEALGPGFRLEWTHDLTLLTVRHGDGNVLDDLTKGREVLVEQRAGATWRRVLQSPT